MNSASLVDSTVHRWTPARMFLALSAIVALISMSGDPSVENLSAEERLIRSRHWDISQKIRGRIHQDLEVSRQLTMYPGSFPFFDLPEEVGLIILSYCSEWRETYLSLLLTSRNMLELTHRACVPRMPILLIGKKHVVAFNELLLSRPGIERLVHSLWLAPEQGELETCCTILKKCTRVRSLFCTSEQLLQSVCNSPELSHTSCKRLTLPISSGAEIFMTLRDAPSGRAFFRNLTHLRVIGDRVPMTYGMRLTNLTHLSYFSNLLTVDHRLQNDEVYPALQKVILTKRRASSGGLRISKVGSTKAFRYEIPRRWTELGIWYDCAIGRGIWDF